MRCSRIAKGLGVGWVTLEQWLPKTKARNRKELFRRLLVTKSLSAESQGSVEGEAITVSRIVVKSSNGLIIEGLAIAELALSYFGGSDANTEP